MSDYTKTTDFLAHDTNNDTIVGSDFETEFNAVATMSATKANKVGSPTNGNLVSMDGAGDTADSSLKAAKTPQLDTVPIFEKAVVFNEVTDNGSSGTSATITWATGNKQEITLTGNCTFSFTSPGGPASLTLVLTQDATGSRTATWPAAVKWPSGVAPTLSTGNGDVDIVTFLFDGTNYYGNASLDFS